MIAPEPFLEPRGTPFSEFHRIRALIDLGHQVDLVTYPFGTDVSMPGLRVFRCLRPPFVRRIKVGPPGPRGRLVSGPSAAAAAVRPAAQGRSLGGEGPAGSRALRSRAPEGGHRLVRRGAFP